MNDKAKLGLSIAAIILCGGFIVSFVSSSGTSADFPDGGTWAKCSACGEMQVIDPEIRGQFYDDNPDQDLEEGHHKRPRQGADHREVQELQSLSDLQAKDPESRSQHQHEQ